MLARFTRRVARFFRELAVTPGIRRAVIATHGGVLKRMYEMSLFIIYYFGSFLPDFSAMSSHARRVLVLYVNVVPMLIGYAGRCLEFDFVTDSRLQAPLRGRR